MSAVELPISAQRVARLLRDLGHNQSIVWLPEAGKTSAQAAAGLGCSVAQIAKSIVFRRRADNVMVMVITSGVNRVDEAKVAAIVGSIDKASAAFVKEQSGYVIGGVCPIGHSQKGVLLLDQDLAALNPIWAAAGHPHAVFSMTFDQLLSMTQATVADIKVSDAS